MRIAVCLKRVPDSAGRIRPAAGLRSIETVDLKFITSPYDEIALEEALRLKEAMGTAEVVAVSLGPPEAQAVLRQALAMGADRAIHVQHGGPSGLELDGLQVARALAAALRPEAPDLVLFGKLAIDDQSAQVGGLVAAELGIACAGPVMKIEWAACRFRFHRQVDERLEVVEALPPVAATAEKGLNEPRYPGIKGIMAARKKPLAVVAADPGAPSLELLQLEPPPSRRPGRIVGEGPGAVDELLRLLRDEAKVI